MPAAVWLALAGAQLAWVHLRFVVPRLTEPADNPPVEATDAGICEQPSWVKPRYAGLATTRTQLAAMVLGGATGATATLLPGRLAPLLLVLAGPVTALVLVDLLTTYLPRSLTWWCWLLAAPACVAAAMPGGRPPGATSRMLAAATLTCVFFWCVWRIGGGLGFGDVRLAPLLALAPAALSWSCWVHYLLLGTIAGALAGLAVQAWRRSHPHPLGGVFPYGPALWLGCWAALVLAR